MDLTIISSSDADFSFLNSIAIYLSAKGLDEIKVAWKDNIDGNPGNFIKQKLSPANLKDYLTKPEYSLSLNTITDEVITGDHKFNVHSVFFVDAKLIGV